MPEINIANSAGRDAIVNMESVSTPLRVRWIDSRGRQARNVRILKSTIDHDYESRVYIDDAREMVHRIRQFEIVRNADGSLRERRPRDVAPQNVSSDAPLSWSGVFIKKSEVVRKFVFANKLQLMHINGLTYDFLYGMAKELEEKNSMMLRGAGLKNNQQNNQALILRRGSVPYRGFLEGRTQSDRYVLLLHLSNLEMKAPEAKDDESKEDGDKS